MSVVRRIADLFTRSRVDREIDLELQSHINMRIDDNLAAGLVNGPRGFNADSPARSFSLSCLLPS